MAINSRTAAGAAGSASWVRDYLRDHTIHAVVILFLAFYPGIYRFFSAGAEGATLALLLLPSVTTMIEVMYFGVFAMSFDFVSGYTGYLSFGHSLFFGIGIFWVVGARAGYFADVPVLGPDSGLMILMVTSMVAAFVVAILIGLVSFRLTGVYFAMITLGFAELAKELMISLTPSGGVNAGGDFTLGVPLVDSLQVGLGPFASEMPLPVLPWTLSGTEKSYMAIGLVVLIAYFMMQRMIHSPFGTVMLAIRENEDRAKAIGYNTYWYKLAALGISGFFGAVGGALAAGWEKQGVAETHFSVIEISGDALLATLIGGIGTLAGPLYGFMFDLNLAEFFGGKGSTGLVAFLRENFSGLLETGVAFDMTVGDYVNAVVQGHSGLYIGLTFIIFVLYIPGGFLGTIRWAMGGTLSKAFPAWIKRRFSFLGGD